MPRGPGVRSRLLPRPMSSNQRPIDWIMPGLRVLRAYDASWLPADLLAGLSVAAIAVPIAIAYSALAAYLRSTVCTPAFCR